MHALWDLDLDRWHSHALHDPDRVYPETNCFLDAAVELVAAMGGEPEAMLGQAAAGDFEGDQWTFFKPSAAVLRGLYGIEMHETVLYLGLERHLVDRIDSGRTLFPEVDAYYLPDTVGTTYHERHDKTSVIVEAIDPGRRVLRYFHNAGFFELSGDDYDAVLAVGGPGHAAWNPYADVVDPRAGALLRGPELHARAREFTRQALAARPGSDAWVRFAAFLGEEVEHLADADPQHFHELAFATTRMAGSSFEMLADHVRWLLAPEVAAPIADDLGAVVAGCKALSFRMARRRTFDVDSAVTPIAVAWERAIDALEAELR